MITAKHIQLTGSNNRAFLVDIHYKSNQIPKPVVIFVHGFKGFKDWGHFNLLANYFAERDFVFVKFNFSHNGTTVQNPLAFDDLEAFGHNNFIYELNDLQTVIDWVANNNEIKAEMDTGAISLLGHSRGGGISVIKAAEESRIKKLVTWAAVGDILHRDSPKAIEAWKTKGVVYTQNARTNQQMPIYAQFYETLMEHKERLNIGKAALKIKIPFLIVHGTNDEAVRLDDAKLLHNRCKHSELLVLDGAGHTFGISHPWEKQEFSADAQVVIDKTLAFLK